MKVIRPSCEVFRIECWKCYALLEYNIADIEADYVQCPCCGNWISCRAYARPVRESEGEE